MTSNLFTMFSNNIDGAAIMAGSGPCANAGLTCPLGKRDQYNTDGIKRKPVFFYSGVNDTTVFHLFSEITSLWFQLRGAYVKRYWVSDFQHIFPNSVASNFQYNPPLSCAIRNEIYSAVQNCGQNMALEGLKHMFGPLLYKDVNYQDSGKLWAIDQRPFNI